MIVPGDPPAVVPPGTADQSRHQRALPHGTHGRLQVNRPNLQRVLWQLVPVFQHGPRPTQVQEIHLPPYWGEILTPTAPSYLQAKQSEATKWSPPWAAMPTTAAESPKTERSGGKAGITIAQDVAPIHQLRSTLTLPQPRNLPVPRSQSVTILFFGQIFHVGRGSWCSIKWYEEQSIFIIFQRYACIFVLSSFPKNRIQFYEWFYILTLCRIKYVWSF